MPKKKKAQPAVRKRDALGRFMKQRATKKPRESRTKGKPQPLTPTQPKRSAAKPSGRGVGRQRERETRRASQPAPLPKPAAKRPQTPKQKRRETANERRKRENALRSARSRASGKRGVSSKTKRRTIGKVNYTEVGFELTDILRGNKTGNGMPGTPSEHKGDDLRANLDAMCAPYLGKTVQVTYYIAVESETNSGFRVAKRVRRTYHDFKGRLDVAEGVGPSVRYSYEEVTDEGETLLGAYVTTISLQVVGE